MFTSLSMTNFRKCRDESMTFGPGLNVIRGQNEASKSTRFQAMAYAMFGVDALNEPLADVVTWGEKESSLKVVLKLRVNKNQIEIRRGKSGAEIDVDGKLVATGQKEVTRFVEGLLGAAPKVASKLMLANQASLRGALAEGPTATAQLIEQLSNFALIDEIILLVQEKLPSGSPVALEQQVKTLSEQLASEKPGELDVADLQTGVQAADAAAAKELIEENAARGELIPAKVAADQARGWARALESARTEETRAKGASANAEASLAKIKPECNVSQEELTRLRGWVQASQTIGAAQAAHAELVKLQRPEVDWEGDRASFDAAVKAAGDASRKATFRVSELQILKAQTEGKLIKESACAFCGKDLKDVPEVLTRNSELGQKLTTIESELFLELEIRNGAAEETAAYDAILAADRQIAKVYAKHAKYIELLDTHVPPHWEWTGPDLKQAVQAGASTALAAAETEVQRASRDQGQKVVLEKALADAQASLRQAQAWIADLEPKLAKDRSTGLEKDLETKIAYHQARRVELANQAASLRQQISTAQQLHAQKVTYYGKLQTSHKKAMEDLDQLQLNNVLLKKLRGARPRVADKLWSTVLSTVSHYFSAIRGVQSVVTRDDAGFKVDGKPVPGLSGSTLDALGLAIRIALTKTFLPNNDFLILDEPAAACDDERESNMLGVVTTAGFEQVLLVTHSALADAFAEQVVTL